MTDCPRRKYNTSNINSLDTTRLEGFPRHEASRLQTDPRPSRRSRISETISEKNICLGDRHFLPPTRHISPNPAMTRISLPCAGTLCRWYETLPLFTKCDIDSDFGQTARTTTSSKFSIIIVHNQNKRPPPRADSHFKECSQGLFPSLEKRDGNWVQTSLLQYFLAAASAVGVCLARRLRDISARARGIPARTNTISHPRALATAQQAASIVVLSTPRSAQSVVFLQSRNSQGPLRAANSLTWTTLIRNNSHSLCHIT